MGVRLAAVLTVGVGAWGVASAASQAQAQVYAGQVREIKIDHCGLEPGMCAGSLVLAQARGQQIDLAIPAGTTIQRGDERVHLEQLGVGNYVRVQAAPRRDSYSLYQPPSRQGHSRNWTWEEVDTHFRPPLKDN
jgi:hypothetical protein